MIFFNKNLFCNRISLSLFIVLISNFIFMSVTLYVGNISYAMKEDDLRKAFSKFGEVVSVKIITDKRTGRSKGYGFVEMDNDAAATDAINQLNGQELAGRNVKVNKANNQVES